MAPRLEFYTEHYLTINSYNEMDFRIKEIVCIPFKLLEPKGLGVLDYPAAAGPPA